MRLADGWFAGRLGWWRGGLRHIYGDGTGLVAQLELTYADGSTRTVTTDHTWRCARGAITSTSFYDGETYVADDEPVGWESPGFDDSTWEPVGVVGLPDAELVGPQFPSMRIVASLPVRDWLESPSGRTVADFGQVFTGHVRLLLRGRPGSVVTLRVAEVLEAGELALRPQRTAANTDRVVLGASGELDWEPTFTFRSLRYAAIDDPAGVVVRERRDGAHGAQRRRPHRVVRVLRRRAEPAARERGVGHRRQHAGRADRLHAARRAARVDR